LTQLVLTSSMILVSTVVSLPCVSHDCSLPVLLTSVNFSASVARAWDFRTAAA